MRWALLLIDKLFELRWRLTNRTIVAGNSSLEWRGLRVPPGNRLSIGSGSLIRARIVFESTGGDISIGDRCFIGRSLIACKSAVVIGNDVVISWGCTIVDHNSHPIAWADRKTDVEMWRDGRKDWNRVKEGAVVIEDKVWLGFGVSILKGVRIGEGAVIGAGAVVTKDIPAWSVAAGNPARVLRTLEDHER